MQFLDFLKLLITQKKAGLNNELEKTLLKAPSMGNDNCSLSLILDSDPQ